MKWDGYRALATINLLAAVLVGALAMGGLATPALAQQPQFDRLANLPFAERCCARVGSDDCFD
jgi:hypothetical protein